MASNNQINVQLNFTANTAAAKKNIEGLQQTLTQLAVGNSALFKADATTAEIQKVSTAATELQYHLTKSLDASGTLNLKKFNASLKTAGANINQLSSSLLSAGSGGAQAFVQLSTAISQANVQTSKLNLLSNKFFKQLKRTAEFQISNTVYQMAINGLKNGYEYAQELNKSLNDIRIVSGQSAQQMADFAKQANKAAQALSSNTTAYTNAALIYYQQGLSDEQVVDRTNVTIKMANVTGDTAQTVSDQMTAIWNNFDDGSKSLEYYADVLTALGAATASSTDEIAEGVEKFAAIGKVTGLSYEYATAALATLVDRTRQSADTVGNSLKTIFSRLQGLSLGETLDDGLDLNKYSKALATVGVQILDVNGQMKDMDVILEDLASRWTTLDQGQKMALAQTVAGVRQYNNLISLLDNWDFMQQNLQVAYNSEGTITEQAEIYAESWEAAKNRTKAALEDIYQDLIDDKFFISMQNGITNTIQSINDLIEGLGGIQNVLLMLSGVFSKQIFGLVSQNLAVLGTELETFCSTSTSKILQKFGAAISKVRQEEQAKPSKPENMTNGQRIQMANADAVLNANMAYQKNKSKMSYGDAQRAEIGFEALKQQQNEVNRLAEEWDKVSQNVQKYNNTVEQSRRDNSENVGQDAALKAIASISHQGTGESAVDYNERLNSMGQYINQTQEIFQTKTGLLLNLLDQVKNKAIESNRSIADVFAEISPDTFTPGMQALSDGLSKVSTNASTVEELNVGVKQYIDALPSAITQTNKFQMAFQKFKGATDLASARQAVNEMSQAISGATISADDFASVFASMAGMKDSTAIRRLTESLSENAIAAKRAKEAQLELQKATASYQAKVSSYKTNAQIFSGFIGGVSAATMGIRSLKTAWDTLNDPDVSGFERMTSVLMSLTMGMTTLTGGISKFKSGFDGIKGAMSQANAFNAFKGNAGKIGRLAKLPSITANSGVNEDQGKAIMGLLGDSFDGDTWQEKIQSLKDLKDAQTQATLATKLGMTTDQAASFITALSTAQTDEEKAAILQAAAAQSLEQNTKKKGILVTFLATASTKGLGVAFKELAASIWTSLSSILPFVLALVAVVAVVALIVVAIKNYENAQQRANRELQEAKNLTNDLRIATEEAVAAVQELKDAYSSWTDANQTLDELVEGTQAWKEQLLEVNNQALELIEKYPELAQYMQLDGSRITFGGHEKEVVDKLVQEQVEEATNLQSRTSLTKANEIKKQTVANFYNGDLFGEAGKRTVYYTPQTDNYGNVHNTTMTQDAYNALPVKLLSYADKTLNEIMSYDDVSKIFEVLSSSQNHDYKMQDANGNYIGNFWTALKTAGLGDLEGALKDNTDLLDNLIVALQSNESAINGLTDSAIASSNSDEEKFTKSNYKNALTNFGKSYYDQLMANPALLATDYTKASHDDILAKYNEQNGNDTRRYIESNGKIVTQTKGTDGTWSNVENSNISFEDVAKNLNSVEAADAINNNQWAEIDTAIASRRQEMINNFLATSNEYDGRSWGQLSKDEQTAVEGLIDNILNSLTFENIDINNIKDSVANSNQYDFNNLTETGAEALHNMTGPGAMSDADYQAYEEARKQQRLGKEWNNAEKDALSLDSSKKALELTDEAVESFTQSLIDNNELLQKNKENADDVAQQMLANQVGYKKLTTAVEKNSETLETADEDSIEYAEAIGAIQKATNEWLDTDFSSSEILENLELIQKAAEGDEEAMLALQKIATEKIVAKFDISSASQDKLTQFHDDLNNYLADNNYEIGMTLEGAPQLLSGLDAMVQAGEMTAEEMNKYLSSIGFEPDIEWENIDLHGQAISEVDVGDTLDLPNGGTFTVTQEALTRAQNTGTFAIPRINAKSTAYAGPKSGGGAPVKKSGGGGGGGGSKKTKEKKPADNKDRYHTVDQQLEDLSNQLDELGDAEDRAFGAEKIKTMAREMAKLNEQVAKYNDKLVEAQNYLTQDRAKAEDFASKIGMSIQYGANGEVLNWDELKKGYLDWYNAGVDKYNAGGIDDDAFSKQYDDVYSDAMDAFDQLEETNNLVQELKQNILDTQREYEDMYLAIQKEKLEINITIDENGMKLLEYFFDKLDDDLYDSVERMSILEDQVGNLIDQASAYEQNINNLLGTAGQWDGLNFNSYGLSLEDLPELLSKSNKELYEIFGGAGSNVQEIIDQLQNDYEKLLDTNKEITETRQKLIEEIGNSFEAWNSEIDEAEERLEDNASLMEHYRNVIDIVGRKTLGITSKFIKDYNIKQLDNDLAQLSASYAQLNKQREAVSALEQAIMRETSEETKALMQKELDDMRDALNEQVEDTAQKWEDCMRGIQEAYEDTVSVALDDWQTKMAGLSGSADMLQLSFDMATDIDDNYLDDYDKIYELSKLSADINNSIDDTDNIQSKEDLIALMEKVNELNESDADISQYTVDVLRARYELLKAEDALKEAQNAKSTVRLTQDNEGNWMYTYTADQDAVSQAEQEYADKLHALEEVNQNYINDLDQKLADLTKSASEKINQIAQDSTLTLEEKKEKIQEVYEYTNEMERYLMEQTQLALEDAMEIYEVDAQKYSELTGNKMLDDEKWVNSFEEMKIAQITGFTELQDWDQQFSDSWDDTVSSLITTTDEFVEKNAEAFDTVKMDIKNASEEMGDDLNQIADDTNKVRDSIIDMGADAEQTIVSVIDYAKTWSDEWSTAIDAIISKNEQLAKSCDTIISKLADAQAANDMLNQQEAEEAQRQAEQANSNGSGSSGKGNYSGGGCGTCSSGCQGQTQSQTNTCVKSCSGSCQEWCGGSSCMGGCKSCSISCSKQCKTTTSGGCFAPDTKVLMADLTEKEIQYIELGDIVMSYDEKSQIFMPKKVTKIYPHYNTPEMIKINFQDDTFIELTPGHPILSQNGWRSLDILNSLLEHGVIAQELQYEDIILGYYNNYNIKLIQKLNIGNNYTSYNLEVEDYHTFITNGIVAHNKKVLYDHNANFTLDTGGYTGTFQYADTGMYTGQWANGSVRANGRLAFLHQKELVLNAHDTENFLQAVDIVRNLNESLDLGALSMSKGLGNITARGLDQNTVQTIDQNVSIKAEFPNVQDRNEIEEAFNNLINKASQYANRKNK